MILALDLGKSLGGETLPSSFRKLAQKGVVNNVDRGT